VAALKDDQDLVADKDRALWRDLYCGNRLRPENGG
jgi:hypothetical protein